MVRQHEARGVHDATRGAEERLSAGVWEGVSVNNQRASAIIIGLLILGGIIYGINNGSKDSEQGASPSYTAPADSRSSSYSEPAEFHGYDCTADCSGHEAGYRWAEEHDIADEDDCGGNSESFIEGCKAYVEEQGADEGAGDGDRDDDD